ncbi:HK97 family phage prohead protease [Macrococcoides caseolyticum subsp. caseolyticum]|uniref:HK97 family phage prohead protease n=1 Tax=Macrococcoides caseolyticum TaxID=69966 RepID=UPI000CD2C229|nr:HK97 family phage prohead protease [Macrococcus caseolyticus]PNZ74858.1 HK97 family phage prohead protease [Macrococcus caseolyticus]QPT46085.1 HK97 family phage prohead protease [Macrococcus caseolyticus]RAK45541.1 HK97 family phage prohead protease [Macrococcus caseolyticus subsp. caseolyticus]HCD18957.1 HK97 family phage prohead protease [Macrococcus caseolyticus]
MKEIRSAEIQTDSQSDEMVLEGTAIVFNKPTEIHTPTGSYTEVIKRNALDGLKLNDTRLLVSHDMNRIPLAKSPKTMDIWTDDVGMHFRAKLPDTEEARSVYTAVKRGDLTGMSFGFTCNKDGSHYDVNTRTRIINKIDKVLEFSVVNYPAYQEASVEARQQIQDAELKAQAKNQALLGLNKLLIKEIK